MHYLKNPETFTKMLFQKVNPAINIKGLKLRSFFAKSCFDHKMLSNKKSNSKTTGKAKRITFNVCDAEKKTLIFNVASAFHDIL